MPFISQSSIVNSILLSCPRKFLTFMHFHAASGFKTAAHPAARRPWRDCTESPFPDLAHTGILNTIPTQSKACKSNLMKPRISSRRSYRVCRYSNSVSPVRDGLRHCVLNSCFFSFCSFLATGWPLCRGRLARAFRGHHALAFKRFSMLTSIYRQFGSPFFALFRLAPGFVEVD